MEVTATCQDRILELYLKGELDHHGAKGLLTKLEREIEASLPSELVLDFSGITFMDSAGIAVALRGWSAPAKKGAGSSRVGANDGHTVVINTKTAA